MFVTLALIAAGFLNLYVSDFLKILTLSLSLSVCVCVCVCVCVLVHML